MLFNTAKTLAFLFIFIFCLLGIKQPETKALRFFRTHSNILEPISKSTLHYFAKKQPP
jgi:hypothetical protein